MFNCFVAAGEFVEVCANSNTIIPWLFKTNYRNEEIYLDFDGYNSVAGVAFEYNGPGHYANIYSKGPDDKAYNKFLNTLENDKTKRKLAAYNKLPLIIIHYEVPFVQLEAYVKSRLKDLGKLKYNIRLRNNEYIPPIPEPPIVYNYVNPKFITI